MQKSINQTNLRSTLFNSEQYDRSMFVVCLLYSLTAIPLLPINDLFKNIIIIGSLPIIWESILKKQGDKQILFLFLVAVIIQILSWANSLFIIPDDAYSTPKLKTLTTLFFFVFISFWIRTNKFRKLCLYGSLITSFVLTAVYQQIINNSLFLGLSGQRIDLAMHNAQYTSMLSVIVIGLTLYITANIPSTINKMAKYTTCVMLIIFSLYVLMISQSRQVWLALALVLVLSPILFYRSINLKRTLVIYLCLAASSIAVLNISFIKQRIFAESAIISQITEGQWNNIPMSSVGIRVNSWLEASKWIARNPILGSDRSSVGLVIRTSEKFKAQPWTLQFGHLHNYYMETLVAYGLIGLLFVILLYRSIIKNIWQNYNYHDHVLLLAFIVFWAIVNCFESYNSKTLGLYSHTIILAGLYNFFPAKDE